MGKGKGLPYKSRNRDFPCIDCYVAAVEFRSVRLCDRYHRELRRYNRKGHRALSFRPLGLGYWQIVVALISGIAAKEVVVSSCSVLFGVSNITGGEGMGQLAALLGTMGFGAANAYALMVFCLLYVPCTATIATINA